MKTTVNLQKEQAIDTLFKLKKTCYGKFQMPEQVNPVAIGFDSIQIVGIVFGSVELFRQLASKGDALSCTAITVSGLLLLYSAVIRFLYAMCTYQMAKQVRRPRGNGSYYDVFISKMTSVTYSVECVAYSLMMIALNKGIAALVFTVLGPSVIILTLVIISISLVRNVSYFDTSLTQTFNLIFNMIVLLDIQDFKGKTLTIYFFSLGIVSSILDAINSSLPIYQFKGLGRGATFTLVLSVFSTLIRTASIGVYFLAAYRIANHLAE